MGCGGLPRVAVPLRFMRWTSHLAPGWRMSSLSSSTPLNSSHLPVRFPDALPIDSDRDRDTEIVRQWIDQAHRGGRRLRRALVVAGHTGFALRRSRWPRVALGRWGGCMAEYVNVN